MRSLTINKNIVEEKDNFALFEAEVIFFKLLKKYFVLKNQIKYFQSKNAQLSLGKEKELFIGIEKSLLKFNNFLKKNLNKNIDSTIELLPPASKLDKTLAYLEEKFDSQLETFKEEFMVQIEEKRNKWNAEAHPLKKLAKINYAKKYKNSYNRKNKITEASTGYAFAMPAFILLGIFLVFSIGFGLYMSFYNVKASGTGLVYKYLGFEQYKNLFKNEAFIKSLKVTMIYMAMVAPLQTVLSLVLSALLTNKIKGKKLFTILYFLPTLTSSTALTLIFLRLFGNGGPLSTFLGANFVNEHILGLVAIMNIWTSIPYFLTIFNAAHADIPKSQYEAASIDGASPIKTFFKITVPYLKPVISFVLLTSVIWTLQTFDQVYIIGKDPSLAIKSETITTTAKFIYDAAFSSIRHQDFGKAAAASIVLALIILFFSLLSSYITRGSKR